MEAIRQAADAHIGLSFQRARRVRYKAKRNSWLTHCFASLRSTELPPIQAFANALLPVWPSATSDDSCVVHLKLVVDQARAVCEAGR